MNQSDIDYRPFSRPKQYYLLQTQLRSGVKGSTYTNNFYFRRYPKLSTATALVWLVVVIGSA